MVAVTAAAKPALGIDYGAAIRWPKNSWTPGPAGWRSCVADPGGGRYARPLTVFGRGTVPLPPETAAALAKPGFKTMHMPRHRLPGSRA
ncbi:hypothetical protein ACRAWD_21085 [Caulobacter segnis]